MMPQIVLGLAAVAASALATVALAPSPRGRLRWSFGLGMTLLAAEAVAAYALIAYTDTVEERLLWIRLYQASGLLALAPWGMFAMALATPWWRPVARPGKLAVVTFGVAAVVVSAAGWHPSAFEAYAEVDTFYAIRLGVIGRIGVMLQLLGTVALLPALEAALRTSRGETRWRTKYLVLGLGGIFLVRFYFLSQAALFSVQVATYLTTTAATLLIGSVVVAISLARDRLGIELSVSREVVYRSVAVSVLGLYLVALGVLGWLLNRLGMPEELAWGSVIVFVTALALAAVMLSETVRWRIKRMIALHFYRTKYDYRQQWTAFTRRLGSLVGVDELAPELLQAVTDAVGTKTALLFLRDGSDGRYHPMAAVGMKAPAAGLDVDAPLAARARSSRDPMVFDDGVPPGWLDSATGEALGQSLVLVPLRWRDDFIGMMLVGTERTGTPYTAEDVEFLSTVAQQAAGALATARLSETLARAREFEAFHRLTSFVIHDLKNSISALSLLTDNALKHFDDPEFQRDAVKTLARTVERMQGLLARLSSAPDTERLRREPVDLPALVQEATAPLTRSERLEVVRDLRPVPGLAGDPEALLHVIENLVKNAAQSIPARGVVTVRTYEDGGRAVLEVTDTGCGMSEEFLRTSLFSPFRSTKRGGWGIGLYQTKSLIEAHDGTIEVTSKEAVGTTFRVRLPANPKEGT